MIQRDPGVAFVFSGHGSQWWGMERELLETEPVFARELEACDAALQRLVGWSLLERLADPATRPLLARGGEVTQPAIFSMQVALAALLRSHGVEPGAVVGHSLGEIAAAHVAGALSREDALRIVVLRGELLRESQRMGGAMALVLVRPEEMAAELAEFPGRVFVAGWNGPASTLLAGRRDDLRAVVESLRARGKLAHVLRADGLAHCPLVEGLGAELEARIGALEPRAACVPFYSSVTGARAEPSAPSEPAYWARSLREPVAFARSIEALARDGYRQCVELTPHPVVAPAVAACFRALGAVVEVLPTMHRERPPRERLLETLAALRSRGLHAPGCAPTT